MSLLTPIEKASPEADACWALVERLAASSHLRRAPRLREFLFYVSRRSLREGCQQVHEQEIGVEVFGRPDTYDTGIDNIVRANATELRKRIEAYFETEGASEPVRMEIPRGSYVPVFSLYSPDPEPVIEPAAPASIAPPEPAAAVQDRRSGLLRSGWEIAGGLILALALAGCVALWIQNRSMNRMLYPWKSMPTVGALWSGFFDSGRSTDIVMEDDSYLLVQNLGKETFTFNDYLTRNYMVILRSQNFSPEIHSAQALIAGKTLARAGEVRLVGKIQALNPAGRNLHVFNAREYGPDLLTRDNLILFGSPTSNPWTGLFQSRLNFTEEANSDRQSSVTNHAPEAGEQAVYTPTDTVAYAVVAYLPKADQSGNILLIEGTSSEATEAGGDFLLSEDQLSAFQKKLHVDKLPYFEALLRVTHVTGTPITEMIEAYRTHRP
ncbi:MAG TPA: hypothetical protein VHX20_14725 [Terracidiphilus sp.]|jgi:hypothetical protein|nr:hypothetical protein [Terracidiphilus sp.]